MPPKIPNAELIEHRLTEIDKKLAEVRSAVLDPDKGVLKRLDDVESVANDVKAIRSWVQRLGIAALGAVAMTYWESIKAVIRTGGSP